MIQELLSKFGLTDKETLIYLTILEKGKIAPAAVAKITKINRTTVYSVSKELVKKGLISEDLGGSTTYLVASSPQEINTILESEEKILSQKKIVAEQVIKELEKITQNTSYSIPKITFIEENNLMDYLKKRTAAWDESILKVDGFWWGFQDPTFVEHYQEWIDWYWPNAPKDIAVHVLTSESEIEEEMSKKYYPRRVIKVWKKGENFSSSTWVCGDYLILTVTNQRPHYLVEIHDVLLAHNMRELFKGIWDTI